MKKYFIQPAASARLEDIYRNTFQQFGPVQADKYLHGAFAMFEAIAEKRVTWQRIPPEFGVEGYFTRYESHFVFWKLRPDGQVAIVAILHQRMDLRADCARMRRSRERSDGRKSGQHDLGAEFLRGSSSGRGGRRGAGLV